MTLMHESDLSAASRLIKELEARESRVKNILNNEGV